MRTLLIINDPPYGRSVLTAECGSRTPDGSRRSTLDELTDWTLWADKVLVF